MSAPSEKPGSSRLGLLALACLLAAFVADVTYFSRQSPERVATHFDLHGNANGWMSRTQHVQLTCIAGVVTPLVVLGVFSLTCRLRGWGLNIPNKTYWLAPEREQESFDFIRRQGYWFAALVVVFHAGLFHAILAGNSRVPPALATAQIGWLTGGFLTALALWIVVLFRRFRLPRA